MTPEPVTATSTHRVRAPVFIQTWAPSVFLHWPIDLADARRLLPTGCEPDTFDGTTWVGLIPLVIRRVRVFGSPPMPYLSTFVELNVRLYSVDPDGRRGIHFLSLDAARLVPVIAAQMTYRLPYKWSSMSYQDSREVHSWRSVRRWPGPPGAKARVRVRVGAAIPKPSPFEVFLTARWNLHTTMLGRRLAYAPAEHEMWPLNQATLLDLDENVIQAAGLPKPTGDPHVLFSPGVTARIGAPVVLANHS